MASIKPIETTSVHRIQSGQVIVDLCSVVKELLENSIDAGATSLEVRFRNNGLDAIEVADNGSGVAPDDYESVALKHHTSKLRSYDDLTLLDTFGFRGEALSSLCALSDVHIVTAQEHEAPKATRLDFEASGALRSTTTQAAQKGTTVYVETIFKNLPVRRQELTKNIKREYGKVLGLLQAYACISTQARISVSNIGAKGKKTIQFATKAGQTTRENIANIYGTKTTAVLIPLDLQFDMQPTSGSQRMNSVRIVGHVSRPTIGDGRQTPDRQMFFVNGRPCILPQVAKAMNEVYKGYNLSQSPFIFADVQLDTNSYDVNVSPDKRTIMLHEQGELLDSLRETLTELFDNQRQSVPQAKTTVTPAKLPGFNPLSPITPSAVRQIGADDSDDNRRDSPADALARELDFSKTKSNGGEVTDTTPRDRQGDLIQKLFTHKVQDIPNPPFKKPRLDKASGTSQADVVQVGETAAPRSPLSDLEQQRKKQASTVSETTAASHFDKTVVFEEDDHDREAVVAISTDDGPLFVEPEVPSSDVPVSEHSSFAGIKKTQAERIRTDSDTHSPSIAHPRPVNEASVVEEKDRCPGNDQNGQGHGRSDDSEEPIPSTRPTPVKSMDGPVPNAFDRMRPLRTTVQKATITIGDQTTTTTIGSSENRWTLQTDTAKSRSRITPKPRPMSTFQSSLKAFAAPGSQMLRDADEDIEDSDDNQPVPPAPVPLRKRQPERPEEEMHHREKTKDLSQLETVSEDEEQDPDEAASTAEERDGERGRLPSEDGSDDEYLDDNAKKEKEDARVAKLIQEAEERAAHRTEEGVKRAGRLLKGGQRAATTRLLLTIPDSVDGVLKTSKALGRSLTSSQNENQEGLAIPREDETTAEERLALTVSKEDFSRMRIAGQFNLGFIIALRPALSNATGSDDSHSHDELFIIDQHASDEKYNFERLQATTMVQNQPLVHKQQLDLTAIEEEIIVENQDTLQKNGFEVEIDESGDCPVGKRCTLIRLPMSKEVTFSTRDLEELVALLAESPPAPTQAYAQAAASATQRSLSLTEPSPSTQSQTQSMPASTFLKSVVRPSAVRKMFAMRACRSSVMIGKTLNQKQMRGLVTNMGLMEKPWNCPHGRPTMRHLYSFGQWKTWREGNGVSGMVEDDDFMEAARENGFGIDWAGWLGSADSEEEDVSSSQEGDEQIVEVGDDQEVKNQDCTMDVVDGDNAPDDDDLDMDDS